MSIDAGDDRYVRQVQASVIGVAGQAALRDGSVIIVGCGALGSAQAELLARAGVGRIHLVDRDIVEMHNLQRQSLFDERDVAERLPKAVAAQRRLACINSDVVIDAVVADVCALNVRTFMEDVTLILDGTDNFETRYLLNDAAVERGIPYVYGGVLGTRGTVMLVDPGKGPCLRCIGADPPDGYRTPTCFTDGVLNTAVAWVAALQSTIAMRYLVTGSGGAHRLVTLDVWEGETRAVSLRRSDTCRCCRDRQFDYLSGQSATSK